MASAGNGKTRHSVPTLLPSGDTLYSFEVAVAPPIEILQPQPLVCTPMFLLFMDGNSW